MKQPSDKSCANLKDLLSQNPSANQYFSSLPPIVRETLNLSHQSIQSEEELRRCAQNMQ